jgi:hypothetical protein
MQHQKNQIAIPKQENQLRELTSLSLPKTTVKTVKLHIQSKKIRDYNQEDFKSLYDRIMSICKLIGITNAPDNDVMILLLDHLKEHHSNTSREEIYNAFSMASAGKLDFELIHYNRMTPQIISKVIKSYVNHRQKSVAEYKTAQEKQAQDAKDKEEKPKEYLFEHSLKSCLSMYSSYIENENKNKLKFIEDYGSASFKFLFKIKCLKTVSESKKKEYFNRAIEQLKAEYLASYELKSLKKLLSSVSLGNEDSSVKRRARGIILLDFFGNLEKKGIDFKQLIISNKKYF